MQLFFLIYLFCLFPNIEDLRNIDGTCIVVSFMHIKNYKHFIYDIIYCQ